MQTQDRQKLATLSLSCRACEHVCTFTQVLYIRKILNYFLEYFPFMLIILTLLHYNSEGNYFKLTTFIS